MSTSDVSDVSLEEVLKKFKYKITLSSKPRGLHRVLICVHTFLTSDPLNIAKYRGLRPTPAFLSKYVEVPSTSQCSAEERLEAFIACHTCTYCKSVKLPFTLYSNQNYYSNDKANHCRVRDLLVVPASSVTIEAYIGPKDIEKAVNFFKRYFYDYYHHIFVPTVTQIYYNNPPLKSKTIEPDDSFYAGIVPETNERTRKIIRKEVRATNKTTIKEKQQEVKE